MPRNRPAAFERAMPTRRFSRRLRWFVAACYLLVVAAAGATPWLADPIAGAVCSSAGSGDADAALDCPLCLPVHAAAPPAFAPAAPAAQVAALPARAGPEFHDRHRWPAPPVRGPPRA